MLFLCTMAFFGILTGKLVEMQVVHGAKYAELADGNRIRLQTILAPRGRIYDRNGIMLAGTRPAFSVSVLDMGRPPDPAVLERLGRVLGMSAREIQDKIRSSRLPRYEPIVIKKDISPETHALLEEMKPDLPGVLIEVEPARFYPGGSLAAHILGYLREIDEETLAIRAKQGYRMGDMVGKTGIEALLDVELHGKHGGRQVEVDAFGRRARVLGKIDPLPGKDVTLTIDARLQEACEKILRQQLEQLQSDPVQPMKDAKAGAVVAMDPTNGDILAMASEPSFDPNWFAGEMPLSTWQALVRDPFKPLTNRAISGEYAPGSAFKMVTAIAALEEGKTSPRETVVDTGVYWRVAPKKCWAPGGHGRVDLIRALAVSCNVYFYEMGLRVGIDALAQWAREFGLGLPTGLELVPKESEGLVPDRRWKKEAHSAGILRDGTWYEAETMDAAIGQGFHRYTPLQMAVYVSALANGGTRYVPRLIKSVAAGEAGLGSGLTGAGAPRVAGRVEVSPATLKAVREGMLGVNREGGTAAGAFQGFPIPVAGKTGTVELAPQLGRDEHGWYVGYAPADDPRIALAVIVEHGGGGSRAAAPIARRILEAWFQIKSEL